jgi:hypothetical protein
MIVTRSSSDVKRIANASAAANGRQVWNTGFMGTRLGVPAPDAAGAIYPDAYLVEQGPTVTLPPHFHRENEFQVVLSGSGTFGNEPVQSISVHYAGAYTPYGPIVAGPDGIGYLTCRATFDPGARTMPAALDELRAAGRAPRDLVSEPLEIGPSRRPATHPECETVLGPESDGLTAWLYRLPAGATVTGPDPAAGGGQFWVVLDGEMRAPDGALLPPRSCVFVSADEPAQHVASAPGTPLAILAMQFPV